MPLGGWHILYEEQDALEVPLGLQLPPPPAEEGGAHVEVELVEAVRLREVSVPQPDGGVQRQLPQQEVVHPPGNKQTCYYILYSVALFSDLKLNWRYWTS